MKKYAVILLTLCLVACGDSETPEEKQARVEDNPLIKMANKVGDQGLKDAQKHADKMQKLTEQIDD